jgi:hypothetical protein
VSVCVRANLFCSIFLGEGESTQNFVLSTKNKSRLWEKSFMGSTGPTPRREKYANFKKFFKSNLLYLLQFIFFDNKVQYSMMIIALVQVYVEFIQFYFK